MEKKYKIIGIIFIILFLAIIGTYIYLSITSGELIGSNSLGEVRKSTYSINFDPKAKIAIVSGIHPRETLSINVIPEVTQLFALQNDVEIVNYKIKVIEDPQDFYKGRANGEQLAHDFIVKDVAKENFDLVIIAHDHEPGYGEGFYIATPSMDNKSVELGEKVVDKLPDFKLYKRDPEAKVISTSITKVNDPIVKTGTPLFVYEIPEWYSEDEAFKQSYDLLKASFKVITGQ